MIILDGVSKCSFPVLILIFCKKNTVYIETTTFDHVYATKARLILKLTFTELVKSCKKFKFRPEFTNAAKELVYQNKLFSFL